MKRFNEHKRNWRILFLVMLIAAIFGPWAFDRISVPQPHTCRLPNVRLDDKFCGVPVSITWLLGGIPSEFFRLMDGLITGTPQPYARSGWLAILFCTLLVLPLFNTLVLLISEKWNWIGIFHRISLGLATSTALFVAVMGYSASSWRLWGVWLYVILTASLLVAEMLARSKNQLTVS